MHPVIFLNNEMFCELYPEKLVKNLLFNQTIPKFEHVQRSCKNHRHPDFTIIQSRSIRISHYMVH